MKFLDMKRLGKTQLLHRVFDTAYILETKMIVNILFEDSYCCMRFEPIDFDSLSMFFCQRPVPSLTPPTRLNLFNAPLSITKGVLTMPLPDANYPSQWTTSTWGWIFASIDCLKLTLLRWKPTLPIYMVTERLDHAMSSWVSNVFPSPLFIKTPHG